MHFKLPFSYAYDFNDDDGDCVYYINCHLHQRLPNVLLEFLRKYIWQTYTLVIQKFKHYMTRKGQLQYQNIFTKYWVVYI